VLVIVHGFGEHCGRYGNLVDYFVPRGYALYGLDHRGHGRSPSQRGHINAWAEYRGDVDAFLRTVASFQPGRPLFLLGHSLGALISLDYLMHDPVALAGAIISGAPIEPAGVAKPHLVALARLLSRVWPTFPLEMGLDASALSRDPEVVKDYEESPLVHGKASARFGAESLDRVAWVKAHPEKIRLPLLMVHGGADSLDLAEGTKSWFEQVTYDDKELLLYPGSYHEVHNDLDHQQLAADLESWLARHLD
jgi:alpha-beta hydrolase superfamily lysophospholipase